MDVCYDNIYSEGVEVLDIGSVIDARFQKYQKYSSRQIALFFGMVWTLEFLIFVLVIVGWHLAMLFSIMYIPLSLLTLSRLSPQLAIRIGVYASVYMVLVACVGTLPALLF